MTLAQRKSDVAQQLLAEEHYTNGVEKKN